MLFNVWNPTAADDVLTFDVTRANMPRVGRGDAAWIAACLSAIDVSAVAREWSIQAARSYFYSDYVDEPEWLDRWTETWIVRVALDGAGTADFGRPDPLPRLVDQSDTTWAYGEVDPDHDKIALLPLLLPASLRDAEAMRDELLALLPADQAQISSTIYAAVADRTWLRLTITDISFPERVVALELFLARCRERGITVNRNELG